MMTLPFVRLMSLRRASALSSSAQVPQAKRSMPTEIPYHLRCSSPGVNLSFTRAVSQHTGEPRASAEPDTSTSASLAKPESSKAFAWKKLAALVDQLGAPLDKLGATRTVKVVVIVFLSIFGTLETVFYAKAAMRWLAPPQEEEEEVE